MVKSINEMNTDCEFDIHQYLEKCVVEWVCAVAFDVNLWEHEEGEKMVERFIETSKL